MKEVTRQNFILPEEYLNRSNLIPKEELEKEAEGKYIKKSKELASLWNGAVYQEGYKDGAEPREKQIAELTEQNTSLLTSVENLNKSVQDLEVQIEKMKCCANCVFSESDRLNGTFCHKEGCFVLASAKCKLWELRR